MVTLYVGDPHVKASNLAESENLLKFVSESAIRNNVDKIVILGDLHHNHAVIRAEVLEFWRTWLFTLTLACPQVVVLVGNHDLIGDYSSKVNSLSIFSDMKNPKLIIVDQPMRIGAMAYVPYIHHQEEFVQKVNELADQGAKTLVCHQTFDGSKFDNGMFAPDGFETEALNYNLVISGHVHSRQNFGKVIYPGTATWQTTSDANKDKGLWLVTHSDDGSIIDEKVLDTSKIVSPIYEVSWKEGSERPEIPEGRVTVELVGSSTWVSQQKLALKGKTMFKTKITDKAENRVRKQTSSVAEFLVNFNSTVSKEDLLEAMKEFEIV